VHHATPVVWSTLPEDVTAPQPPDLPDFRFVQASVRELAAGNGSAPPGAVALLDVRGPEGAAPTHAVREAVVACALPVLVRTTADRAADLVPTLRPRDELCLLAEPPALLRHRLRRLLAEADRDTLTGLFARPAFYARLARELEAAGPEQPLSLLLLDLDNFKTINDEHGHLVGDRVLQHCAGLLPTDDGVFAARYGGEEFVVLLPGADEVASLAYAERLCAICRERPAPGGIRVTVSAGVSTTERPLPPGELLQEVDHALYAAKGAGRDRALHFRALERQALRAGGDLRIENFETVQRVLSERVADVIARRGRRLLAALQNQADRDGLTGLFNRGYLDRRIAHDYHEARRSVGPLSVALLDVDFFGEINKTHDWQVGDQTLREIAALVRRHVREDDWVARYGGEEIAVVLPGASREAASSVLERVREAVAATPFRSRQGEPFSVTVSAGVVELRPDETLEMLWHRLSEQLLRAKRGGRNRVHS
jgi:diguanylate cyclase (GGDEF)-like protein